MASETRIAASTGNATMVLTWTATTQDIDVKRLAEHALDEWRRLAEQKERRRG